jgi:acyl-CoA dehydrogenase family member 9
MVAAKTLTNLLARTQGSVPVEQSFMKSLFHGVIADDLVFPYPESSPEERESLAIMLDSVRRFLEARVDPAKIDREHAIGPDVLQGMKELGLFGLIIPQAYGGIGLSQTAYARVMQEIAGHDASLAVTLGAHQSIGLKGILLFGTEAQKRKYLPRLATGDAVAAFALTEPSAGSDAAAIQTRAEPDGSGGFVLNGSKIWITNGGFADVFTVFARTARAEAGQKPKITAFIVERGMGVVSGPSEHKLGIRGTSTTELFFEDVHVPGENVLGDVGRGFKVAMEVLNSGRMGLAAGCVGGARRLIQLSAERAKERKAFGKPIEQFGLIKDKIATMMSDTWASESMTYLTAGLVDRAALDYSLESAICKVVASETLWRIANETLQIAAGIGYMQDYPYERMLRDSRINLIFEGTNEILRLFVALSGMQGPGKELSEVARAIREPIKGFGLLSDFALRKARSALGRERMTRAHPALAHEAVVFEQYTVELMHNVDKALRKHQHEIHRQQPTLRRVAEMAMELYAIAAVVSRTTRAIERRGEGAAEREIQLTTTFVSGSKRRLEALVQSFERNDDELRGAVAAQACLDGGYALSVV